MKKHLLLLGSLLSIIPALNAGPNPHTSLSQTPQIIPLTESEFDAKVIRGNGLILVYFYTDWCPYCKIFTPKADALSKKYNGKITFYKINVDNAGNLRSLYNVRTIPTLLFFKGGNLIDRIAESATPPSVLERTVEKHLRSA